MKYDSLSDLVTAAKEQNVSLSVLGLQDQAASAEKMEEEMFQTMTQSLQVMKESVQDGLVEGIRSEYHSCLPLELQRFCPCRRLFQKQQEPSSKPCQKL